MKEEWEEERERKAEECRLPVNPKRAHVSRGNGVPQRSRVQLVRQVCGGGGGGRGRAVGGSPSSVGLVCGGDKSSKKFPQ